MSRSALTAMLGIIGIGLLARKHGSQAIPLEQESENPRGKHKATVSIFVEFDNPDNNYTHLYDGTTIYPRHTRFTISTGFWKDGVYWDNDEGQHLLEGEIVGGPIQTHNQDRVGLPGRAAVQTGDRRDLLLLTKNKLRNIVDRNLQSLFTPDQRAKLVVSGDITSMGGIEIGVDLSWETRNPGPMLDKILKTIKDSGRYRMKENPKRLSSLNPEITHTKVTTKALAGRPPSPGWGDLCPVRSEWLKRQIKEKQPRPRRR